MLNSWKMQGKKRMTWTRVSEAASHPAAVYMFQRRLSVPSGMRADWTADDGHKFCRLTNSNPSGKER
jgi:hypothetical protein